MNAVHERHRAPDLLAEQAMLVAALIDHLGIMDGRARGRSRDARPLAAMVIDGFDRLLAQRAADIGAPTVVAAVVAASREQRYAELVERVRQRLADRLPEGARLAVISRGDPRLADVPGRSCSHFPQDDRGGWAGYYPATGEAAVAHLDVLRRRGIEWLAVPATSRWWLDHYPELRAHLDAVASVVTDDDDMVVWQLPATVDLAPPVRMPPLDALLGALLPGGTHSWIVTDSNGSIPDDPAWIHAVRPDGAEVLVLIPGPQPWSSTHPRLWHHLLAHHTVLADRHDLATVIDLQPHPAQPAQPAQPDRGAPTP